jgi:two-component system phosphate regulon sensor histidine kinase PhoR
LEERLEHAEARYRRLVEGLGAGVALLEDGVVAFANPAFASLIGNVATEELSGVPFREFVATRDVLQVGATLERLEGGSTERAELRFALRSEGAGGRRLVRGEIARADVGDKQGLLVVLQDETSERRLEEELRQNERRLDAVLESAPEGVLALTEAPDGGFVHFTNRAFLEMFGLREDQVLGATEGGVLRALRERGGGAETVAAFLASAGGSARRETVTLESEPPVEVELRTSPLRDRSGRVLGRMLACRDTTATRHGEDALAHRADELRMEMETLQEAHRKLEASNEDLDRQRSELEEFNQELRKLDVMKSNLLANVSHELQTPLVSIRGYTEMILRGRLGDISEEQRKGLELSLRNIDRLIAMIDNLLEFSRMQREEGELTLEDFPLAGVIDECRELLRPKLERRRITCGVSLDDPDLVVHADRDKIQQVFLNLLTNAIKYNRDGGRVEVHARKTSHGLASIQVRDTGIGIATEDLDRIFDRFYHADQDRGTGLGLSIVRNILRLHGCTIRATSRKGDGTVFTFTLPLGERREHPDEPDAADGPANGKPGAGQPPDDGGDPPDEDGDPPRLRIIRPVGSDR